MTTPPDEELTGILTTNEQYMALSLCMRTLQVENHNRHLAYGWMHLQVDDYSVISPQGCEKPVCGEFTGMWAYE